MTELCLALVLNKAKLVYLTRKRMENTIPWTVDTEIIETRRAIRYL